MARVFPEDGSDFFACTPSTNISVKASKLAEWIVE
jgi:hypothetical protein